MTKEAIQVTILNILRLPYTYSTTVTTTVFEAIEIYTEMPCLLEI